jgi:hypothetical protein
MYLKACKILGINVGASQEEIKKAYRKLAASYHPDVNDHPDAPLRFIEINKAYLVLSKPNAYEAFLNRKRAEYKATPVTTKSAYYKYTDDTEAYLKYKEEQLPHLPKSLKRVLHFLDDYYEYLLLALALVLVFVSPIIYFSKPKKEQEELGWLTLIGPLFTGFALLYGVLYYMAFTQHPLWLKVKKLRQGKRKHGTNKKYQKD